MRRTFTFDFFTFRPRWRSYHWTPKPINWLLFRWGDFALLFVAFLVLPVTAPEWVLWLLAGWYFVGFPVLVWRRLAARRRFCATQGHTPHRPSPDADEWECLYCGTPLRMRDPGLVATAVANAAAQADLGRRRRPQAYYSDRR